MQTSLYSIPVRSTLDHLYADAREADLRFRDSIPDAKANTPFERFELRKNLYMPVGREFGKLIYTLARSVKAETAVEFGTSFGISTIFLAGAVRDNGGGRVITSEFIPEKAAQAEKNLAAAGLGQLVEVRVGDALETLKDTPAIDFVFLDGAKELYIDVLKILHPRIRSGGVVVSDNTDHSGIEPFLEFVRDPQNGYLSSAILTNDRARPSGHEISIRL